MPHRLRALPLTRTFITPYRLYALPTLRTPLAPASAVTRPAAFPLPVANTFDGRALFFERTTLPFCGGAWFSSSRAAAFCLHRTGRMVVTTYSYLQRYLKACNAGLPSLLNYHLPFVHQRHCMGLHTRGSTLAYMPARVLVWSRTTCRTTDAACALPSCASRWPPLHRRSLSRSCYTAMCVSGTYELIYRERRRTRSGPWPAAARCRAYLLLTGLLRALDSTAHFLLATALPSSRCRFYGGTLV